MIKYIAVWWSFGPAPGQSQRQVFDNKYAAADWLKSLPAGNWRIIEWYP